MGHQINHHGGRKRVVLDPRSDAPVTLTAQRNQWTELLVDGTRDAVLLPPGSQWKLIPTRLYLALLVANQHFAETLHDRGEDVEDNSTGLAAELIQSALAREAQEV